MVIPQDNIQLQKKRDLNLILSFLTPVQRAQRTKLQGVALEDLLELIVQEETQTAVCKMFNMHPSNGGITDELEKLTGWKLKQRVGGKKLSEKLVQVCEAMALEREKNNKPTTTLKMPKKDSAKDSAKETLKQEILKQEIQQTKQENFIVLYEVIDKLIEGWNPETRKYVLYKLQK